MKNKQLSLLALGLSLGVTNAAFACGTDTYIGTVCTVAFNYCPIGTLEANGQELLVSKYQALYSLFGVTYGGTQNIKFNLPDLRGRSVVGMGTGKNNDGKADLSPVTLGQKRGNESMNLSVAQLPAHSHVATFNQTGSNPITVNIPVSTANGTEKKPTVTANKLAVVNNDGDSIPMWTSNQIDPINIGGVTTSGGSSGTVTVGTTGGNAPIATIPPQLGMKQCIVVNGLYPQRPN